MNKQNRQLSAVLLLLFISITTKNEKYTTLKI